MDGVVRPLKKALLTVFDKFKRRVLVLRIEIFQTRSRYGNGCGDVVLDGEFGGRIKVLAQTECPPCTVLIETDAHIVGDQPAVVAFELVAGHPVDKINTEM